MIEEASKYQPGKLRPDDPLVLAFEGYVNSHDPYTHFYVLFARRYDVRIRRHEVEATLGGTDATLDDFVSLVYKKTCRSSGPSD